MWSDTSNGSWLGTSHGEPAATSSRPRLRARSNICPHNRRWSRASRTYSCHRTPASLSWAIILFLSLVFISYPSSSRPDGPGCVPHHSREWFSFCDTDTTQQLSSNSLCFTGALQCP
ncbi:hypothetical protein GBF38_010854 [Nibea albiflora]|uniref:Uncharacterized protein n=1 Tax=Nibea albiflora TaxID=240163 RepID=A0ACB7ET56_NIBAL|nr:hypothetical protein GBF38_010854 [Nibea albiflora]